MVLKWVHGAQIPWRPEPYQCIQASMAWMQAPVTFAVSQPTGQPGYVVTLRNKNWFSSTEGLIFSFRLLADGVPIRQEGEEGWTQFDIAQIAPQVPLATAGTICHPCVCPTACAARCFNALTLITATATLNAACHMLLNQTPEVGCQPDLSQLDYNHSCHECKAAIAYSAKITSNICAGGHSSSTDPCIARHCKAKHVMI